MSINISQENLITFTQLAGALPRRRANRPVHCSTIHRWRSKGLRGVRLEAVRIGGAWHTSWEAFQRFTEKLTANAEVNDSEITERNDRSAAEEADKTLRGDNW